MKFSKGDYVNIYCGKMSHAAGIFVRTKPGAYIDQTVALVNVKNKCDLSGREDIDNFQWFRVENLTKMSEDESSKYNWILKDEK